MQKKWMVAALAAAMTCGTCVAQMSGEGMGSMPKPGSDMATASFDGLLGFLGDEFTQVADAMPADKFDFAPKQDIFKDSWKTDFMTPKPARTFGDQVKHVAQANYYFFGAPGSSMPAEAKAIGSLKTKAEIMAALKKSFEYAHAQVQMMRVANAFDPTKLEGNNSTRAANIAFGMAHMNDHMGQMSVYLRMCGIVPPQSRK